MVHIVNYQDFRNRLDQHYIELHIYLLNYLQIISMDMPVHISLKNFVQNRLKDM